VKQLAVGNIDHPDKAWDDMEVPKEIGIDFHILEKLGQEVAPKGNPVISAGRREVSQVIVCLNDFVMCHAVTLNEETGQFQEKDEQ